MKYEEVMRYPHILSVEAYLKDDLAYIIDRHTPVECEAKCMGNNMWQLIFYATEEEYDAIAKEIEERNFV